VGRGLRCAAAIPLTRWSIMCPLPVRVAVVGWRVRLR